MASNVRKIYMFEHISLMALEQVEMEFVEELQELQVIQQEMQQMGAQNPAMAQGIMQNPQVMQQKQRVQEMSLNAIESTKSCN